jgi:putative tricarboxylic transport membrane protein
MVGRTNRRDLAFGALMVSLALFALWESRNYDMGTADQMSTGYMPWLISVLLLSIGAIIGIRAFFSSGVIDPEPHAWLRPLVAVAAALLVFMVSLNRLGLIVSSIVLVLISGFASRETRPVGLAIWAVVLAIGSAAVFVYLIGLPMSLWPK